MKIKPIVLSLLIFCTPAFAEEIDVLIAKTSLALGDEYAKILGTTQSELQSLIELQPTLVTDPVSESPNSIEQSYYETLAKYNEVKELALSSYGEIICDETCGDGYTLLLPEEYAYIQREAYSKIDLLQDNISLNGNIGKYAPIYAVNSNFESDILERLTRMVDNQKYMDKEARNLLAKLTDLQNAKITNEGELTNLDLSLIKEDNYDLESQTQLTSYQNCIDSHSIEEKKEQEEFDKAVAQYDILVANMDNHLDQVFDQTYSNGTEEVFKVNANSDWLDTGLTFTPGDHAYISVNGQWNVQGSVSQAEKTDAFFWELKEEYTKLKKIYNNFRPVFGAFGYKLLPDESEAARRELLALKKNLYEWKKYVKKNNAEIYKRITAGLTYAGPEGYFFSFSKNVGKSNGRGSSSGISVGFIVGGSQGRSSSRGSSSGSGVSGAYALKLQDTIAPDYPVGALIGSYCTTIPNGTNCPYFLLGQGNIEVIPSNIGSKTLWLRANDHATLHVNNSGTMTVEVSKRTKFISYWDQYVDWIEQECDENGENCGLYDILENIAYIPNPFQTAKASFYKKFPNFPAKVSELILNEINYLVEIKVILRDIRSKEISGELNETKISNCNTQLELTKTKLNNIQDSLRTYSQITDLKGKNKILLSTSQNFYENELASINRVRDRNLQRIRKFFKLAINSYNYLYLDQYNITGEPLAYNEGEFYSNNIEILKDLVFEITTVNDLLNPNRGFAIYELSKDELAKLTDTDFRNRKVQVKLDLNELMCQGFNLRNQSRVMLEKVGVLLDINPQKEHLFFQNSHKRGTKLTLTHGSENHFYDFLGNPVEYWMPSQKRDISAYSTRVLVDANSDYEELRESRFYNRLSFRKTSLASTWRLEMLDPTLTMYDGGEALLEGVKLVLWYNSTETQTENPINKCLIAPNNISVSDNSGDAELSFELDELDSDHQKLNTVGIYRSENSNKGFSKIAEVNPSTDSNCSSLNDVTTCTYTDATSADAGKTYYYRLRSIYESGIQTNNYLPGLNSNSVSFVVP